MNITNLTFYGGVNEIGGNKILLEDKDTRIFLDFGKGFSTREQYFEEYLKPRSSNGIMDLLTMDLIPDIEGIYRDDLMENARRKIVPHSNAAHIKQYGRNTIRRNIGDFPKYQQKNNSGEYGLYKMP